MRNNPVVEKIASGRRVVNGWLSVASPHIAETLAQQGYDSLTIDLQHGAIDYAAAFQMLQAISNSPAMPMVRVPWNDPAHLMKVLDAGAYGVICPMINTAEEAEAFVSACRYPPRGMRSFGPNRAVIYAQAGSSRAYASGADAQIMLLAMIETRKGLENLDAIIATPGLDGIYIGPGDLSLSLGHPPTMAPNAPEVLGAMQSVLTKARAAGRIAAVHTDGPQTALVRFGEGFQLCTLQGDVRLMSDAAAAQTKAVREGLAKSTTG